jgi:hypothetical protein
VLRTAVVIITSDRSTSFPGSHILLNNWREGTEKNTKSTVIGLSSEVLSRAF